MKTNLQLFVALAAVAAPVLSQAQSVNIRENTVIPVIFNDELTLRQSREGDRFYATVENDRDLPSGTRLLGEVRTRRESKDGKPGYLDLEFNELILPRGTRTRIQAIPIRWDEKKMQRDRDGRFTVNTGTKRGEGVILGSTAAGLIIGSIIKKPAEGAIIGALVGVVAAENDRKNVSGNVIVAKGQKMGAYFERAFTVETGRWSRDSRDPRNDRDVRDDVRVRDDENRYGASRPYDQDRRDDRDLRVSYRDRDLRYADKERPYRIGDTVMVPLIRTAEQLGLSVDKGRDKTYFVEDDENSLRVEVDTRDYRLNGKRGTLARNVTDRNGVIFISIEVFAKLKQNALKVDGSRIDN